MSSSLVPSSSSRPRTPAWPMSSSARPIMTLSSSEVCTVSSAFFSSRAPRYRATITLTPLPTPMRNPVNSETRMAVEPTAPSARGPPKRPATAISAMLNKTCNTLENISGTLKAKICRPRGPEVRSVWWLRMAKNPRSFRKKAPRADGPFPAAGTSLR